jgi:hypothetical protein
MSIKFKYRIVLIILMIIFISFQAIKIIDSYNKGFLFGLPSFQLIIGLIILISLSLPNHQKEDE